MAKATDPKIQVTTTGPSSVTLIYNPPDSDNRNCYWTYTTSSDPTPTPCPSDFPVLVEQSVTIKNGTSMTFTAASVVDPSNGTIESQRQDLDGSSQATFDLTLYGQDTVLYAAMYDLSLAFVCGQVPDESDLSGYDPANFSVSYGSSLWTIKFNTGLFGETPTVVVTPNTQSNSSATYTCAASLHSQSATSVVISIQELSGDNEGYGFSFIAIGPPPPTSGT